MKNIYLPLLLFIATFSLHSQDDLLADLEMETEEVVFNSPAFKAMKIVNIQSTKVAAKGDFYMYVSHRFGTVKDGFETFFGLDNANTKIQLVYGVHDRLQLGLSRESLRKTYAGSAKLRVMDQTKDFPLNISLYGTANIYTSYDSDRYPELEFADRMAYALQFLVSRRITKNLSVELAPTFVRQNLVSEAQLDHNQFVMGVGGRFKVTKRMSVNMDYAYNFARQDGTDYKNPLSVGIDIETGGHVFQILFANSQSTNEPILYANAGGEWEKGNVYFGFNIVRVF